MKLFLRYRTNIGDNLKFKKISGDLNKIHFDQKSLENTIYSEPICHGVMITLLSIIKLKSKKIFEQFDQIEFFSGKFLSPIYLDEIINFFYIKNDKMIVIYVKNYFETKAIFNLKINNKILFNKTKIKIFNFLDINLKINQNELLFLKKNLEISNEVGNYKKNLNLMNSYFIFCNNSIKKKKIFTRELKYNLVTYKNQDNKYYCESKFLTFTKFHVNINKKFSKKTINFYIEKLKNKRILIIGGTGGIGRVVISFLTKLKSDFCFTYLKHDKLANEICKKNNLRKSQAIKLDLTKKFSYNFKQVLWNSDFIVFLNSPKIFLARKNFFSNTKLHNFVNNYIYVLNNIVECLLENKKKYKIFVPSSKIIEMKSPNLTEYCISKVILEKYAKFVNKNNKKIKIICKRFEAYYTDQANFIFGASKNFKKLINNIFT